MPRIASIAQNHAFALPARETGQGHWAARNFAYIPRGVCANLALNVRRGMTITSIRYPVPVEGFFCLRPSSFRVADKLLKDGLAGMRGIAFPD
ncbi:hypothetical protein PSI23_20495 [Xenorhabdus sp. XENO-10]|uniref:Uncharacterized protein n=1 Tax=Xenorhabdus yunnanensis TaxID=3025878 RepID=A0ABT5LKF2_9GAMM|nr:hypothetical protein [Xenorhabdus yunnanensis]MDC9591593.1 hypothetical protein [Xenorhabdus yunnanensis]